MTATNRTKTFARRVQQVSDLSYQQALSRLESLAGPPAHWEADEWSWPDWHRQVVWMACTAAADAARRAVPGADVHAPSLGGHDGDHLDIVMPATSPSSVVVVTFLDAVTADGDATVDIGFTTYGRGDGEDVGSYALLRRDGTPMLVDDLLVDEHWDWLTRALGAAVREFAAAAADEAHPTVDGVDVLGPNCL